MEGDFEEMGNLMDDDPALDYILYEDMERGNKGGKCRQCNYLGRIS